MYIKNSKTVVIKIGSSLLINEDKTIRKKWLSEFCKDVKELIKNIPEALLTKIKKCMFVYNIYISTTNEKSPVYIA